MRRVHILIAVAVVVPRLARADVPEFLTVPPDATEDVPYTYLVRVRDLVGHDPQITLSQGVADMELTATSLLVCPPAADPPSCDWMATVTWSPDNSHAEQDFPVELVATDTGALTATQGYSLHVNNTNDAPTAEDDAASTNEDTAVVIDVLANDSDPDPTNDALTVTITLEPSGGSVAVNADQTVTYTPASDLYGSDSFRYQVDDGVESDSARVDVEVGPLNDAPTWIAPTPEGTVTAVDGEPFELRFVADDIDSFEIFYDVVGLPATGTFGADTGELGWTPTLADGGDWPVVVTATDGSESIERAVTLRVVITDDDADGLADVWEEANGLAADDPDTDGDTISDLDEVGDLEEPSDSDFDGILDALELDSDADTIADADEAGDDDLATAPVDTDGDGTPDFQDNDSDDDSVRDPIDNCRLVPNTDQADSDRDGEGDACEGDSDGDGFPDPVDACPNTPAPDSEDGCPVTEPEPVVEEGGCECATGSGVWLVVPLALWRRRARATTPH